MIPIEQRAVTTIAQRMRLNAEAAAFRPRHVPAQYGRSRIERLPALIFGHVCDHLRSADLAALAAASRTLNVAVDAHAGLCLRRDATRSINVQGHRFRDGVPASLIHDRGARLLLERAKSAEVFDESPSRGFLTEVFSWQRPTITRLRAAGEATVVAAGSQLYCKLESDDHGWLEKSFGKPGLDDITDIKLLGSHVLVSQVNGQVSQWRLPTAFSPSYKFVCQHRGAQTEAIESIDHDDRAELLATIDKAGSLTIGRRGSLVQTIATHARPWVMRFGAGTSLAVGSRSTAALTLYDTTEAAVVRCRAYTTGRPGRTSVFAIYQPAEGDVIFSGWYDGVVRVHDRRSPSELAVMHMSAPFNDAAVYSLARYGNVVYAGKATSGIVRLFDLRRADRPIQSHLFDGASVFLGGRQERGPVYDLHADHGGVIGAFDRCVQRLSHCESEHTSDTAAYFFDHHATRDG